MTEPIPDDCPVHDLPPGTTVYLQHENGTVQPRSAEWVCAIHHEAALIQPIIEEGLRRALDEAFTGHTDLPACYRTGGTP